MQAVAVRAVLEQGLAYQLLRAALIQLLLAVVGRAVLPARLIMAQKAQTAFFRQ